MACSQEQFTSITSKRVVMRMSHSHEGHNHAGHDHDSGHHYRGDGADKVLTKAIVLFAIVGSIGAVVALLSGRIALAVDSVHNLCETVILGGNRACRRIQDRPRHPIWEEWILPLGPLISALAAIAVGVGGFLVVGLRGSTTREVWIAFAAEVLSFSTNFWSAVKLHDHQDSENPDDHVDVAVSHMVGDMGASGAAMLGYFTIMVANGLLWLDAVATVVGIICIVYFHIGPIKKSLRTLSKIHRAKSLLEA